MSVLHTYIYTSGRQRPI